MPDYTTRGETAEGDIRNALQMCLDSERAILDAGRDLGAVARLLRQALEKLEAK